LRWSSVKCIPLESFQVHVVAEVNAKVCTCGYGPASMLEFFLVNVNGDVCAHEMFQATGVVKMQMANKRSTMRSILRPPMSMPRSLTGSS